MTASSMQRIKVAVLAVLSLWLGLEQLFGHGAKKRIFAAGREKFSPPIWRENAAQANAAQGKFLQPAIPDKTYQLIDFE